MSTPRGDGGGLGWVLLLFIVVPNSMRMGHTPDLRR
jgi:hypothetical protein